MTKRPLHTRQFIPPRHLLPDGDAITAAHDIALWAVERAENTRTATHHVSAARSVVALSDLCRNDEEFTSGPAKKWLNDVGQIAAWLEVTASRNAMTNEEST